MASAVPPWADRRWQMAVITASRAGEISNMVQGAAVGLRRQQAGINACKAG